MSYAISFFGIFARIIDALAWPAVAVFLIWILRDVLRQTVTDLLSRPAREQTGDPDPKTVLVLAIHEAKDQAEEKLRDGALGPAQSEAARAFIDQAQQAIVAIVSGKPVRKTTPAGGAPRDDALPLANPKKKKKNKGSKNAKDN
jgi:hypothetical protein